MKKLEIPLEQINSETAAAVDKKNKAREEAEDITNKQLKVVDLTKFQLKTTLFVNFTSSFLFTLKHEKDYSDGYFNFIPYDVPETERASCNNCKYAIEIYAKDEKVSLKRLERVLKRYVPGRKVEWQPTEKFELIQWINKVVKCFPLSNELYNNYSPSSEKDAELSINLYNFFHDNNVVLFSKNEALNNWIGLEKCFETLEGKLKNNNN